MTPMDFLISQPWLIHSDAMEGLIALAHREPEKMAEAFGRLAAIRDVESVSSKDGERLSGARTATIRDGVAIIPVRGVVSRYATMFSDVCGGTSTQRLSTDIRSAADNPMVKAILLEVDSPGGQAAGIGELAAQIRATSKIKPVEAYVSGDCCSAAYWLASGASHVTAFPTAMLGSIGVILTLDAKKKPGEITIVSSQSPMKRPDLETDAGKQEIQSVVDALAEEFISAIAEYRATLKSNVYEDFGRGGFMLARKAVDVGMIDSIGDFESVLARLSGPVQKTVGTNSSRASVSKGKNMSVLSKFFATVAKQNPEVAEAALGELDASGETADRSEFARMFARVEPSEAAFEARLKAAVDEATKAERAKAESALLAVYQDQAKSFLLDRVKDESVVPADVPHLTSLLVDAYKADSAGLLAGDKGRVGLIQDLLSAKAKGNRTKEAIDAGLDVDEELAGMGARRLRDPGVKADESERLAMKLRALNATPEGRASLERMKNQK